MDLWAREHYKSTIITFALTLFEIINNPEVSIGIFSHTKPTATAFLVQIKRELETNELLQDLFDDIFWKSPQKEAVGMWTAEQGIIVKRKGNPKERTVEAHGLVDGMPTGQHFDILLYDDLVTEKSVTTPNMLNKTTQAFELSVSLGSEGGRRRIVGTRYHFADTYGELLKRKVVTPRIHPCTYDSSEDFTPENCVLMQPETLADRRQAQGPYTFGTQMLLNPKGDGAMSFKPEWIQYFPVDHTPDDKVLNTYIVVDPANEKRKTSDYTTMWAIGLGPDNTYNVLDVVRDRLNLTERTELLFDLHQKWRPLLVGYEKYGIQADIQHIMHVQFERNYKFKIKELGGSTPKPDRIKRLMPLFEQGRIFLPRGRTYTDYQGMTHDLIEIFKEEEYKAFPVMAHDDMLDSLARIVDPNFPTVWPKQRFDISRDRFFAEANTGSYESSSSGHRRPRFMGRR